MSVLEQKFLETFCSHAVGTAFRLLWVGWKSACACGVAVPFRNTPGGCSAETALLLPGMLCLQSFPSALFVESSEGDSLGVITTKAQLDTLMHSLNRRGPREMMLHAVST